MTVTAVELATRVTARTKAQLDERVALQFLRDWEAVDIAEEVGGRWRLTRRGRAMFAGWVALDDEDGAA